MINNQAVGRAWEGSGLAEEVIPPLWPGGCGGASRQTGPGAGRAVVGARAALGPRVLSAGVRAGMPGGGGEAQGWPHGTLSSRAATS